MKIRILVLVGILKELIEIRQAITGNNHVNMSYEIAKKEIEKDAI